MTAPTRERNRVEVELGIVGSMALLPEAAEYASAELQDADFQIGETRTIFRALSRMTSAGVPVDAITLAENLIRAGEFESAGGREGITRILDAVPHAAHCRYYVRELQGLNQRLRLKTLSETLRVSADDQTCDTGELIAQTIQHLELILTSERTSQEIISAAEAVERFDAMVSDKTTVIPTGIEGLDRLLNGGLTPGQICVDAGRPAMGKTVLMQQILQHCSLRHRPALMCSLEMRSGELAGRALKTLSRQRFAESPMYFAECYSLRKLQAVVKLAQRRHGIQIAGVDYLQLIEAEGGKNELRERQVAAMSRSLKILAMELQIPIVLGSQLNRESEKRGRPSLSDLRESGAIEQDADIVILHSGDPESDDRELIVAKNRNGPCSIVRVTFDRERFVFRDRAIDTDIRFGGDR